MRLKNKIAIVTGGGSGFGAGIVKKFIQEGAKVVVADINLENAEKVVKDPSKPIIKKNLRKFSFMFFENSEVIRYPIKKQPRIFTVRVP